MAVDTRKMTDEEKEQLLWNVMPPILVGLAAFFEGRATLMVGELEVRFKMDRR